MDCPILFFPAVKLMGGLGSRMLTAVKRALYILRESLFACYVWGGDHTFPFYVTGANRILFG